MNFLSIIEYVPTITPSTLKYNLNSVIPDPLSAISFKTPANNNINIVPENLINNGSYISHWKNGDKISLKNSTKKISDLFIDNKISNYDKLYYPILKSNKGNVICVPNLATMYYNEFDESKCVFF